MILVKIEAVGGIKDIHPKLWKYIGRIADRIERRHGLDMLIHSVNGDKHMSGSFHYINRAVDFSVVHRNGLISNETRIKIEVGIRDMVNAYEKLLSMEGDIDLIWYKERRFYHIEYDPKGKK